MARKTTAGEKRRRKAGRRAKRKAAGRRGQSHRSGAERMEARLADDYNKAKAAMADGIEMKTDRIAKGDYHVKVAQWCLGRVRKPSGGRWWTVSDSHLLPDGTRFQRLQDAAKAMAGQS